MTLGQGQDTVIEWWRVLLALGLCLGLAVAAAYALKLRMTGRIGGLAPIRWPLRLPAKLPAFIATPAPRRLKLVESLRVSPTLEVCLFTCDGEEFLIAAGPQGSTQLERKP